MIASNFSLIGVNLAGAEFAPQNDPGVYERDYIFPTHQEVDYIASKGLSIIRLPFLMDRLQDGANGPLDARELARLDNLVSYATSKGIRVILDPHDYGYEHGVLIRDPSSVAAFANFWGQVAGHFRANPLVMFGLENEPHVQTAAEWLPAVNSAIAAIRGEAATQQILIPAVAWQSAANFTSDGSSTVLASGVSDPLHNYAFEVHQYLDGDATGTSTSIANNDSNTGPDRLRQITQWATQTGNKLFLGEIGVGTDAKSLDALDKTLAYMQQHGAVWEGVTYFAAGPWWGNTAIAVEPSGLGTANVVDRPQMTILAKYTVTQPPEVSPVATSNMQAATQPPITSTSTPVGQHSLALQVSEDAWLGDAQYTVGIDGAVIGGIRTATTLHHNGSVQPLTLEASLAPGFHVVTVTFINDAYGGTPDTDRNLYVESVSIDGNESPSPATTMLSNGTASFGVVVPAAITPATLSISLSEDAWRGNAQFLAAIDGKALGDGQDVTAIHASGRSQIFDFGVSLGAGQHDIAISFLNDLYGGTPATDRNLYVDSIAVNGSLVANGTTPILSTGTIHFPFVQQS